MKYYIVTALTNKNMDVGVMSGKNKEEAIKKCRDLCTYEKYVPLCVTRISKSYFNFITSLNKEG